MSQPPQGHPPYGADGPPPAGDRPGQGGGWGQPTAPQPPQPGQGWGPPTGWPAPPQPGQGWGQQPAQPAPGGYGPAGWPTPGYGEQPTQVGGFGVPGQPPYGGGPAAPAGDGRDKKKNLVITAVAALVLVGAAVGLMIALDRNDPGTSTATGSSAAGSAPSSDAAGSSAGSSSSGGLSSGPTDGTADPAGFLAQLPPDFTDCTANELAGDGDVAAAACGPAQTQPGPSEAGFYLYPDTTTLDEVFQTDVTAEGLAEWTGDADCATSTGFGEWTTNGLSGGKVACTITPDGYVAIAWTDEEFLTEGVIRASGTTQAEVSALYDWWTANSFYQQD